jgi:hypothetical protein
MSHGGQKSAKKCQVLFEWPLRGGGSHVKTVDNLSVFKKGKVEEKNVLIKKDDENGN